MKTLFYYASFADWNFVTFLVRQQEKGFNFTPKSFPLDVFSRTQINEMSSWAVHLSSPYGWKFGLLKGPIRMLLFNKEQFGDIIESFRFEYEYEIEYEYDFRILNQSRSQSHRFSMMLISRGKGFRDNIVVPFDDLEYAFWVWKVVLLLKS